MLAYLWSKYKPNLLYVFHEATQLAMESVFTREVSCRLSITSLQSNMLIYIQS